MLGYLRRLVGRGTTRLVFAEATPERRVRVLEDEPGDRFTLIIALMIVFFAGLVSLEVIHMAFLGAWDEAIFNGLMLVVGIIVGAVWGRGQ
ncbi:MAG: hypothetical protein Q8O47_01225 [Candidatus Bathyarchaeota archaeon]|nr:hypothetical protein [Candidatus Bathyarchaeota archaeon]